MVGRIQPVDRIGYNLGINNLEFIGNKDIIDRAGALPDFPTEIVQRIRKAGGIKPGVHISKVQAAPISSVVAQELNRFAAGLAVEISHQDGRQRALLLVFLHIVEDDLHPKQPRDPADMVEMGIEHPDRPIESFNVNFRDRTDPREYCIVSAAEFFRAFGKPEGFNQADFGFLIFNDNIAVLVVFGFEAAEPPKPEDAVIDIQQAADILAHIGQKLLHTDDGSAAFPDKLRCKRAAFPPFVGVVERDAEIPLEVEGDYPDQIAVTHADHPYFFDSPA